ADHHGFDNCGAVLFVVVFFFSSRRRHTRSDRDWSSDVCSSDLDVSSRFSRSAKKRLARYMINEANPTTTISRPNTSPGSILRFPCLVRGQCFDLAREAAIFGRYIAFDVGKPAVDVLETRPDVACRAGWGRTNPLPVLLILIVAPVEHPRLGRGNPSRDQVDGQD